MTKNFMHKGQVLIVVLLVLAVTVTIGLSVIARSITEVSISTTQEESARALAAAEAGVEKALGGIIASGTQNAQGTVGTSDTYHINSTNNGNSGSLYYPEKLQAGDVATIKVDNNLNNTLNVCWGDSQTSGSTNPTIEVTLYYRDSGVYQVGRKVIAPNGQPPSNCPSGATFTNSSSFLITTLTNNRPISSITPLLIQLRLLGNGTTGQPVGVYNNPGVFPAQGSSIVATGQSGQSTQKIRITTALPDPPPIFNTAVFSGGSLSQ